MTNEEMDRIVTTLRRQTEKQNEIAGLLTTQIARTQVEQPWERQVRTIGRLQTATIVLLLIIIICDILDIVAGV